MGLDMYLNGQQHHLRWPQSRTEPSVETYQLGYWRKHPNLHGHIVQTYAEGVDECQEIELEAEHLRQIINVIEADALPTGVTGFFFGESYVPGDLPEPVPIGEGGEMKLVGGYEAQKAKDLEIFRYALDWLMNEEPRVARRIVYQASW